MKTKEINQKLVLENFELLCDLQYARKADTPFESMRVAGSVSFGELDLDQARAVRSLSFIKIEDDEFTFFDNIFPDQKYISETFKEFKMADDNENELIYLLVIANTIWSKEKFRITKTRMFLVNNEGYNYSRYTKELTGYQLGDRNFKTTKKCKEGWEK